MKHKQGWFSSQVVLNFFTLVAVVKVQEICQGIQWNACGHIGPKVLTAVVMKTSIFWDVMPLNGDIRFGGSGDVVLYSRR
jgi:hypothetical protein